MSLSKNTKISELQWIENLEDMKEVLSLSPHISTLLILQIIHSLSVQYFNELGLNKFEEIIEIQPFIHRFHGALLFVDISGFTALSQRMAVETLQKHINSYFTKIIDIIHTHSGEIIKFAGDALYVVWKTSLVDSLSFFSRSVDDERNKNIRKGVEKAIRCAMHINKECNQFEIIINTSSLSSQSQPHGLVNNDDEMSANYIFKRQSLLSEDDEIRHEPNVNKVEKFYLSVHSGISLGVMAGVDVTACDRSEFFIVGKPLFEVANAEKIAAKGELVVSNSVHDLFAVDGGEFAFESVETDSDFYRVIGSESIDISVVVLDEESQKIYLLQEIIEALCVEFDSRFVSKQEDDIAASRDLFASTVLAGLLQSVRSHVHEATRQSGEKSGGSSSTTSRKISFVSRKSEMLRNDINNPVRETLNNNNNNNNNNNSVTDDSSLILTNKKSTLNNLFTSELRSVVVLLIKLDVESSMTELSIDEADANRSFDGSDTSLFLPRSAVELESDMELWNLLQSCYSCIAETLRRLHGQVRQFILDDKGSICIGSFGLKGSSAKNGAEAAVSASETIVEVLSTQSEIEASVGITSGRVYCGLVGSTNRYEYSIMGSSVNLSARLMSIAGKCSVICDQNTKRNDSLHVFNKGMQISAKGYANKITIFSLSLDRNEQTVRSPLISPRGRMTSGIDATTRFVIRDHYVKLTDELMSFLDINNTNNSEIESKEKSDSYEMKLVIIEGSTGVGKSHYLSYISQQMLNLSTYQSKLSEKIGFELFFSKGISSEVSFPFQIWRSVIINMLKNKSKASSSVEIVRKLRESSDTSKLSNSPIIESGRDVGFDINYDILGELPQDQQQFLPLLNTILFHTTLFDSNEKVESLSGKEKMDFSIILLSSIIELYVRKSSKNVVLFLDNFELIDSYSFSLVSLLWQRSHNLIIISSLNSDVMNEREVSKDESSVLLLKDKLNVFNNNTRFKHVNQPLMRKSDIVSLSQHLLFQTVKISSKSLFKFASNYIADLCDHNPLNATELSTLVATAILKFDEETKESVEVFSITQREKIE